jgi:phosphatidate cytidylyltransferase
MTDQAAKPEPAGRSLKASVLVGLVLGGAFLASILIYDPIFMALAAVAAGAGAWELSTALRTQGWHVPRIPAVVGSVLIMPVTFFYGPQAQWLCALATVASLIVWRIVQVLFDPHARSRHWTQTLQDFAAAAFLVIYLPLMTSFAVLILRGHNGGLWVVTYVTTVAMVDTFGYLVGRRLGKHKIAPGVSPKKSLEGLIGSIFGGTAAAVIGCLALGKPLWFAALFAGAMILAAVFGDLAESLIKRDLGVKDMSSWLPGHGGVMDRMDSILPATLLAYLLISLPI